MAPTPARLKQLGHLEFHIPPVCSPPISPSRACLCFPLVFHQEENSWPSSSFIPTYRFKQRGKGICPGRRGIQFFIKSVEPALLSPSPPRLPFPVPRCLETPLPWCSVLNHCPSEVLILQCAMCLFEESRRCFLEGTV